MTGSAQLKRKADGAPGALLSERRSKSTSLTPRLFKFSACPLAAVRWAASFDPIKGGFPLVKNVKTRSALSDRSRGLLRRR